MLPVDKSRVFVMDPHDGSTALAPLLPQIVTHVYQLLHNMVLWFGVHTLYNGIHPFQQKRKIVGSFKQSKLPILARARVTLRANFALHGRW